MASNNHFPKWSTPERRNALVRLFLTSGGFCIFGHRPCQIPEHHYELFIEGVIRDWQLDDRRQDLTDWKLERLSLHRLAEHRQPLRGRFSAIANQIWHDRQPEYYLEGLGISGLTFTPFAKVRIAGGFVRLHVNLADSLRGISKNQRRKAVRYGKPVPKSIQDRINDLVGQAVRHYLDH